MTGFLASVRSAAEAETALAGGADIVDFKDPAAGALGALPLEAIRAGVARVAGRCPLSATAGDRLLDDPSSLRDAVAGIAATGVDFVKVGLFPGAGRDRCLDALADQAARGAGLVAVMFADLDPDFGLIEPLADRGFLGVMLDTAGKAGGGLRRHQGEAALRGFVARCRRRGLFTGLAGSLGLGDVPDLLTLAPDYLGFRGALTRGGRNDAIDRVKVLEIRDAIPAAADHGASAASIASAAAGAQRAAMSRAACGPAIRVAKST